MFDIVFVGTYWFEIYLRGRKPKFSTLYEHVWLKCQFLFSCHEKPDNPKIRCIVHKFVSSRSLNYCFPVWKNFIASK